jgi:spermidine dehydrogenase
MISHFSDGNATVARLLVRKMLPAVSSGGSTQEDGITAPFDYSRLDLHDSPLRIRLQSTAVNVQHNGDPKTSSSVSVIYMRQGKMERAKAQHVILACWNRVIPLIWGEPPQKQTDALRQTIQAPAVYTSVLMRNWHLWEKAKVGGVYCPSYLYAHTMIDLPVSIGEFNASPGPDSPVVLQIAGAAKARAKRFACDAIQVVTKC